MRSLPIVLAAVVVTATAQPILSDPWAVEAPNASGGSQNAPDYANAIALQADGRIVVAGSAANAGDVDFLLVRYLPDGTLDDSFGTGGLVFTSFGPGRDDHAHGVGVLPDGRIVVAGYSFESDFNVDFAAARYLSDGSLDAAFGDPADEGRVLQSVMLLDWGFASALDADGRLSVAGYSQSIPTFDSYFSAVRLGADGLLDASFGGDGRVTTSFQPGSYDGALASVLQPDGRLVLGGHTTPSGAPYPRLALVRFLDSGALDATFGTGGFATARPPDSRDTYATGLAVQTDGRLLAAGAAVYGLGYRVALARFTTTGSLDASFAVNGWFVREFAGFYDRFNAVAAMPDGRVVAAGSTGSHPDVAVLTVRLDASGQLDPTFDSDGWRSEPLGPNFDPYATSLAVQPDGRVVVAGRVDAPETGSDVMLLRYTTDGALDPTFGVNGLVTTPAGTAAPVATEPDDSPAVLTLDVAPTVVRDRANVSFTLPGAGRARLVLYDLLGRRATVLVDGERPAGVQTARLDATQLTAGVYILRLDASGQRVTTRVAVSR